MICMQIDKLPGLSNTMSKTFDIIKLIIIDAGLSLVVHRFYNGKEVLDCRQKPIYGFYIANTKFYKESLLSDMKRSLPSGVTMTVDALTIKFVEIDKATRSPKQSDTQQKSFYIPPQPRTGRNIQP